MKVKFILSLLFLLSFTSCIFGQQFASNEGEKSKDINYYHEIDLISDAIINDKSNVSLLNDRALLYLRIKEYEKALADIDKAISINSSLANLRYTKALILFKRKRYEASMEVIDEAIAMDDKNESFYFFRAHLFVSQDDFRSAIHDIDAMLDLNPRCDYCYLQKAIWCKKLNMFYEEIRNYLFYLKLTKDENNKILVERRLKTIRKSDKYFNDLYKHAKKDIRKNGYPWEYHLWD